MQGHTVKLQVPSKIGPLRCSLTVQVENYLLLGNLPVVPNQQQPLCDLAVLELLPF